MAELQRSDTSFSSTLDTMKMVPIMILFKKEKIVLCAMAPVKLHKAVLAPLHLLVELPRVFLQLLHANLLLKLDFLCGNK